MISSLKPEFHSALKRQVIYTLLYFSLFWGAHLAIVSIIVFFHFMLDHNLNIIDSWIQEEAWKIIIISKLLAGFPILKFLVIYSDERYPIFSLLKKSLSSIRRETFVCIILLIVMPFVIHFSYISYAGPINFVKVFWPLVGTIVFYGVDFLIFFFMQAMMPLRTRQSLLIIVIFALASVFAHRLALSYAEYDNFLNFSFLSLLLYISIWRGLSWTDSVTLLVLVIAPIAVFVGVNPIGSETSSLFVLENDFSSLSFLSVLFLLFSYLWWRGRQLDSRHK